MRRTFSRILLVVLIALQVMSFSASVNATDVLVDENIDVREQSFVPTVKKPYEIEVATLGNWLSEYWEPRILTYGYKGDFSETQSEDAIWPQTFHVDQKTRLISLSIVTKGIDSDISEVFLQDVKGNIFKGFQKATERMAGLIALENSNQDPDVLISVDDNITDKGNSFHTLIPKNDMVLPSGDYTIIYSSTGDSQVNPFYVKGYNEKKYQSYLKEVDAEKREWEKKQSEMTAEEEKALDEESEMIETFGEDDLAEWYKSFTDGDETSYDGNYSEPDTFTAPVFVLDNTMTLDQILMNTYNNGQGAEPGIITLYNEAGEALYEFQSSGAGLGDVANALWVALPGIVLEKGVYYLEMDNPQALGYDESGNPIFSVSLSMLKPPVFDFTGSYTLKAEVIKTSTLMGPVSDTTPSFTLNGQPVAVIDKGSSLEVVGTYNGMQFSQDCEVLERTENTVTCRFTLNADLSNLPYKAKIGADVRLSFDKPAIGNVTFKVEGVGTYDRKASKNKGEDHNTYSITGEGRRVSEKLPFYVMAALAKIYGVGNIPGPNSPIEAVAGLLFPPLIGVVISVIQGLIGSKKSEAEEDPDAHLSVGEKAMKAANNSLGQGLVSEEEKEAWKKYAEALGASGGDPEDPFSVGDNESGSGYEGSNDYGSSDDPGYDYGYDSEDSNDSSDYEDTSKDSNPADEPYDSSPEGKSESAPSQSDKDSKPSIEKDGKSPDGEFKESDGSTLEEEPITAVVPTNTKGSTKLVQYNKKTNKWFDPETGNEYDHEANMKFLGEEAKRLEDYHQRNDYLNKTKQTAMDEYIKKYGEEHKKELNAEKMEKAKIKQAILEAEQKEANEGNSALGILNQTKVNIINEVDESVDTVKKAAKDMSKYIHGEIEAIKEDIKKDPDFWKNFGSNIWDNTKEITSNAADLVTHPIDTLKDVSEIAKSGYEVGKTIAGNMIKGAKAIVTDPHKAWEWVKDNTGIQDFINSQDMNKSMLDRIGNVITGTIKLGTTIVSVGEAKAAAEGLGNVLKGGKTAIKNTWDDIVGVGAKSGSKSSATAKGLQKELSFTEKGNYIKSTNPPNMSGMTDKSKKTLQIVSDDMGVRIQVRPTNEFAKAQIESGRALPKPQSVKIKTADAYDELLGGPKDAKGLTVVYEPELPPKEVMNSYSKDAQKKILDKYNTRMEDFKNQNKILSDLKKKGFDIEDGKVIVRDPIDPTKSKYIAGDNDIYDITNFDGSPLSDKQKQMVIDRLVKDPNANVLHGAHMDWKPGMEHYTPEAKAKIVFGHSQDGGKFGSKVIEEGEGLVTINPYSSPTKSLQDGMTGLSPAEQKAYMDLYIKKMKGGA